MTNLKENQFFVSVALTEPQRIGKSGNPYVPVLIRCSSGWNCRLACSDVSVKPGDKLLCELDTFKYAPNVKVLKIER